MFVHRIILVVALVLTAPSAYAFFDPPWITPAEPRAGEAVSVNIHGGICDGIFERPGYPLITQQGNAIQLIEYGHHWEDQDLCIYGIGTLSEPIGAFAPGDYTVSVELFYVDELGFPQALTIGVIPFTVTGATPATPVPAFSVSGRLALLSLVPGLALWGLRMRRQRYADTSPMPDERDNT